MLCEICNKNEATIHIQEIVGGQKKSLHLCSSCAAAKQQSEGMEFGPFDLAGLLYKLAGNDTGKSDTSPADNDEKSDDSAGGQLVCPQCGWTGRKVQSTGRLGCGNCYRVFASMLSDALKKMHRGSTHLGKQPVGGGSDLCMLHREIARLQQLLLQAVKDENYEAAARYRDNINELKVRCDSAAANGGGELDHE